MNEPKPNAIAIDSETLDRLVDGELSPAEYRRVLQALEQQPGAWRKCAEAFLQAQAWQLDMQVVRAAAEV
jgi:anti-sigma factor RsiW